MVRKERTTPAARTTRGCSRRIATHAANGSAIAPGDYAATSSTLTFQPGDTTKTVTVNVNGWVGSDTQLARKIRDELNKLGDRNAGSGVR